MFTFTTHPAAITVTDGIQVAITYLQASWRRWLPVIVAIAALTFVVYAVVWATVGTIDLNSLYYVDNYTHRVEWYPDASEKLWSLVAPLAAVWLLSMIMTLVGSWVFNATAIAGLRDHPVTVSGVVVRGLLTVVSGLAIAAVAVFVLVLAFVVLVIVAVVAPVVGALLILLVIFAAIPVGVYLEIRVIFTSLAVFDGFGPIEGIRESWRLSQRSVLRLFGWGLMALLITLGFSFLSGVVSAPFSSAGLPAFGQAGSTAVTTTASCFSIFMMAVLYESQRARFDPTLYGPVPGPVYPGFGYPGPGFPGPYPPGPYPYGSGPGYPGPYPSAPGPYPAGPYSQAAIPGWVNPNAPQAVPTYPPADPSTPPVGPTSQGVASLPYAGAVPGYPGSQPPRWVTPNAPSAWPVYPPAPPAWGANPQAGPAWKPDQSEEPPASGPKPTDPPGSS